MKKGFSHFGRENISNSNSIPNQPSSDHQDHHQVTNSQNTSSLNGKQKNHQSDEGFSVVKKEIIEDSQNSYQSKPYDNQLKMEKQAMAKRLTNNIPLNELRVENSIQMQNGFSAINQLLFPLPLNQFSGNFPSISNNSTNSEAVIVTLFQIIQSQAKSLQSLYQKVEKMTTKINQFGQKIREMKKPRVQQKFQQKQSRQASEQISQRIDNIDCKTLIKILFGSNKVYQYKLELNEILELPLYRQRNFSISLKLVDLTGKSIKNYNKIPLSLALYSSQNPPKFIEKNTAGQKILKGYIEQSLHYGQCRFEKIQIKEVTSHFRNGWVFIVIIPCMTPLGSSNPNENFIDYLKIQPLVLQKVIVKAKKIKQNKKSREQKEESQMGEGKDSEIFQALSIYNKQKGQESSQNGKFLPNFQKCMSDDLYQEK